MALRARRHASTSTRSTDSTRRRRARARAARRRRAPGAAASTRASRASSPPADDGPSVEVVVDPDTERLELLEPFPAWDGERLRRAAGAARRRWASARPTTSRRPGRGCATAATSRTSRGNLFIGANNAFTGRGGRRADVPCTATIEPLPDLAKHYKDAGIDVGRGRRRELRRGLVARARGDGAALHGRPGDHRALVRPHPRGEPQEAGRAPR